MMAPTITYSAGTDAVAPKLFFAWDAQPLCSSASCYDDAVRFHL